MGQPDVAVRLLAERYLPDLLSTLLPGHEVEVLSVSRTELKVVERLTDEVVRARVDGVETLLHVEFAIRHDDDLPRRVLAYHALLAGRHAPCPVLSLVVYLMHEPPPRAVPRGLRDGQVDFHYAVFCPWERPIDVHEVRARPALAPLAVLTPGVDEASMAAVRRAIEDARLSEARSAELMAITYILAGRRFSRDLLDSKLWSKAMEDSCTYRHIFDRGRAEGEAKGKAEGKVEGKVEGKAEGLADAIQRLVRARLGELPPGLEARMGGMDAQALEVLFDKIVRARDRGRVRKLVCTL